MRTYQELVSIPTYEGRLAYLSLEDRTEGDFGRKFHASDRKRWEETRQEVIARDLGYDMAYPGVDCINLIVHHMNPVTEEMIRRDDPLLYDPNNLVCVSQRTHNYIHYGGKYEPSEVYHEREKGDNCPWQKIV